MLHPSSDGTESPRAMVFPPSSQTQGSTLHWTRPLEVHVQVLQSKALKVSPTR